eukprot:4388425-Pyramimonas_sp.AAC.1
MLGPSAKPFTMFWQSVKIRIASRSARTRGRLGPARGSSQRASAAHSPRTAATRRGRCHP